MSIKKYIKNSEILSSYEDFGRIDIETMKNGDYKTANREYKKIIKLYKYLEGNIDQAIEIMPELLTSDNVAVRISAAAECLALGIYTQEAEKLLEDTSKEKSHGIYRFNAEMTLKVWREKGTLEIYKK